MSSRSTILKMVAANKPAALDLPQVSVRSFDDTPLAERFQQVLTSIGGRVHQVTDLASVWQRLQQEPLATTMTIEGGPGFDPTVYQLKGATDLEEVERVVVKGSIAVAENGAVWIPESAMGNRLLPFLCRQLVVIVERKDLVRDMHEAYEKIRVDAEGYGAFIAGPSKTADIEQSLVIGAHGPLGMELFLVG